MKVIYLIKQINAIGNVVNLYANRDRETTEREVQKMNLVSHSGYTYKYERIEVHD